MARRRREEDRAIEVAKVLGALFILGLLYRPLLVFLLGALIVAVVVAIPVVAYKLSHRGSRAQPFAVRVLDSSPKPVTRPRATTSDIIISAPVQTSVAPRLPTRITEEQLKRIDWFQFEKLMAELYRLEG